MLWLSGEPIRGIVDSDILRAIATSSGSLVYDMLYLLGIGVALMGLALAPFIGGGGIVTDYGIVSQIFDLFVALDPANDLIRNDLRAMLTLYSELPT